MRENENLEKNEFVYKKKPFYSFIKRAFDIFASGMFLLLLGISWFVFGKVVFQIINDKEKIINR